MHLIDFTIEIKLILTLVLKVIFGKQTKRRQYLLYINPSHTLINLKTRGCANAGGTRVRLIE